jgi:predicted ATPase/DNA-binding SARP family transcriptional activator
MRSNIGFKRSPAGKSLPKGAQCAWVERIEFRVLGPVEAVREGRTIGLGGARQRALLALLLLEPGRPVSADRIVEELWRGDPPAGATTTLRSYVSRLRAALGEDAAIDGGAAGYALEVSPASIDAVRFEHLAREGEEALVRGAARRAEERLTEALSLWRGRPFGELADDGRLRLEADRLEERRVEALEARIDAELAVGRAAELVDELESLVQRHPYRERLWRQLMLALYRSERQADALAAYARARTLLDEELGLEPGEELKRLEQAILRHEVPPAGPPEEQHNLPAPVTSFVGRERELTEIEKQLAEFRLVTLTGVGGAGKTRLALELAARAVPDLPAGAWFCDLSALTEPGLLARHVARALDLEEQGELAIEDLLAKELRTSELLLVLDNCEHVLEPAAALVQRLLTGCPGVRVLATSREPLGIAGEADYPVPPLSLPDPDADLAELRSSEAVRLFLVRAREARPRLTEDDETLVNAARIARDLDGLPLALELAAARAKALSLEEIAGRLRDRFRFLVSWRRLSPARHRTLREAMDWSYELLSPEEQRLLAQLSVFAGGFTLDAVARVCAGGDEEIALELLQRLVEASLVVAEEREGEMRYRLLETVREYAAERLAESGDAEAMRRAHAEWCLQLAEEAEPELTGERQTAWFAVLERERDNVRAALSHLAGADDPELRLRLAVALTRFWYVRGYLTEGRRWLELARADAAGADPSLRRRALTAGASFALLQGDYPVATELAEESLEVARETGDPRFVANALSNLGAIVLAAGDHDRAGVLLEEAVALAREVGDERISALAINNLGDLALTVGDLERAEPLFEESLHLLRARGDTANVARALFNLGAVALGLGRLDAARDRLSESVIHGREAGDKEDLAWCLEGFAALEAAEERGEHAAELLGAADTLLTEMGADFKPFERRLHEQTVARALELCGPDLFADALARGTRAPLDSVLDDAVSHAAA